MRVFFIFSLFLAILWGAGHPKIIYLKLIPPKIQDRGIYVGEKLEVKYELLLFDNASLLEVEFIPNTNIKLAKGVELLNPQSPWQKGDSDAYENTFIFKIKSPQFTLPTLKILALSDDGSYTDEGIARGIGFEAIELGGEFYSDVVAKKLTISNVKAKKYDEWNNIVVFDLGVRGGNIEDFNIPQAIKQGFNGDINSGEVQSGMYYAVIPNAIPRLKVTYFNLQDLRYEEISFPISVKMDRVSTQSDLVPKNTFLIFSNILLALIALILLLMAFYFRKNRIVFYILFLFVLGIVMYILLEFENKKTLTLVQDSPIAILPTSNSTIMENLAKNSRVKVIGERGEFYKIDLGNMRIGWIKKDACQ
ncbi:SH3 domain-containing protein [Helicobacter cholecystus]|uniref:SH3 domain-containing protein n=1 Tax=Helicobacter cholecystus TaxID=45498 RepID=A0A3D8IVM2_9HELI|nr:SH3 domain-containing protein [Helicobacter cholecystus]RDU68631.1 SH3 domain-containing protein [Helicobacter cholecystus]VEJ24423.1 Putative periplasmic protein [Helicobacter cholecystus]